MRSFLILAPLALALVLAGQARGQSYPQRLPPPEPPSFTYPPANAYPQTQAAGGGQWVYVPSGQQPAIPNQAQYAERLPTPAVTDFGHVEYVEREHTISRRLGPTVRIFEPKARVYFDTGWEAPDKLNLFHDGTLSASINFLEVYWQYPWLGQMPWSDLPLGHEDWRWGPALGIGISPQAGSSADGSQTPSGAPVLMLSAGLQFDFPLVKSHDGNLDRLPTAGLEFGYALGVSSDESLDYIADGAIYVGVTIHVLP